MPTSVRVNLRADVSVSPYGFYIIKDSKRLHLSGELSAKLTEG